MNRPLGSLLCYGSIMQVVVVVVVCFLDIRGSQHVVVSIFPDRPWRHMYIDCRMAIDQHRRMIVTCKSCKLACDVDAHATFSTCLG